jgi:hypothetical protein
MPTENVQLDAMPKQQARVLIAQDVIQQLEMKKLVALSGTYCKVFKKSTRSLFTESDIEQNRDVRDVLLERAAYCQVCAKGAILIATILRFDQMPVRETFPGSDGSGYDWNLNYVADDGDYKGYFSRDQLRMIEIAFEGWYDKIIGKDRAGVEVLIGRFPRRVGSGDHDRLIAIMQNIIDNGGTFKPEQFAEALQ